MDTYSSSEVCQLADVTYRQLDYWTRCGLVEPYTQATGSGSRRRWSDVELVQVKRLRLASTLRAGSLLDSLDALATLELELADLTAA